MCFIIFLTCRSLFKISYFNSAYYFVFQNDKFTSSNGTQNAIKTREAVMIKCGKVHIGLLVFGNKSNKSITFTIIVRIVPTLNSGNTRYCI